ncbi:MAG: hypothetical protein C4617_01345 [Candidatus Liberibacter europaeus]|uniref:Pilus assembly protein CpaD n=1 Tax=Candidatus Liberibacter europaeus TaxID=744859 RepID=A0A2T4VXJ3_9HYPH|nr:hypothetical protein [Candidatus Liberibacter europaeus]PTL86497.1 MAG: hypothetical protein C4617_01345 [Candidatus Liberibacter europaeus]
MMADNMMKIIFIIGLAFRNFFEKSLQNMVGLRILALILLVSSTSSCILNMTPPIIDRDSNYPVVMKKQEKFLDLKFLSGRWKMNQQMIDSIRGFLASYKADSSSVLFIMIPSPTVSSNAIQQAVGSIHSIIISYGIPFRFISNRLYDADYGLDIDTIRLSYFAMRPYVRQCGLWPRDMLSDDSFNGHWANYGCSFHHNWAVQAENPLDLFSPREMTYPDSDNRMKVIENNQIQKP